MVKAVLLLFAYKYDLFTQKNKRGDKPTDISYSAQIRECIEIMEKNYATRGLSTDSSSTPSSSGTSKPATTDATRTAIGKNPEHVLLSLDGGGIRGLVLVRVSHFISGIYAHTLGF